jgi:hypothetical protein
MYVIIEKHFVNLTNGIEAIPMLEEMGYEFSFIRIQSTQCENHKWDKILQDLDYNFLMSLALGHTVHVYDYGANKEVPRAIFQGMELIMYVLLRRWYGKETTPYVRRHNCQHYFNEIYQSLEFDTKRKLDYFRRYLNPNKQFHLVTHCKSTNKDNNYEYYKEVLHDALIG